MDGTPLAAGRRGAGEYSTPVRQLPITLCISTRNAAPMLAGCIESVRDWVSEIVIVDMESSDETLAIARSYGAQIVAVPAAGWAEPGRQAGIDAGSQPWMLVLDADERAAPGLRELAAGCVGREDLAGVWLPRQNFQLGWWVPEAGTWPDWQLRLFRPDRTTWSGERTHVGATVDGTVEHAPAEAAVAIVHHSFASIHEWMASANSYTDLEATRIAESSSGRRLWRQFVLPLARFLDEYVRRGGYKAGRYGLSSALMSLCYWTIAEMKAWEKRLAENAPTRDSVREPSVKS